MSGYAITHQTPAEPIQSVIVYDQHAYYARPISINGYTSRLLTQQQLMFNPLSHRVNLAKIQATQKFGVQSIRDVLLCFRQQFDSDIASYLKGMTAQSLMQLDQTTVNNLYQSVYIYGSADINLYPLINAAVSGHRSFKNYVNCLYEINQQMPDTQITNPIPEHTIDSNNTNRLFQLSQYVAQTLLYAITNYGISPNIYVAKGVATDFDKRATNTAVNPKEYLLACLNNDPVAYNSLLSTTSDPFMSQNFANGKKLNIKNPSKLLTQVELAIKTNQPDKDAYIYLLQAITQQKNTWSPNITLWVKTGNSKGIAVDHVTFNGISRNLTNSQDEPDSISGRLHQLLQQHGVTLEDTDSFPFHDESEFLLKPTLVQPEIMVMLNDLKQFIIIGTCHDRANP